MNKLMQLIIASLAIFTSLSNSAFAALPDGLETGFTTLGTDHSTLMGYVWTLAFISVPAFVYLKWFKKGVNRAT